MTIQDVDKEFQKRVLKDMRLMEIRSKMKRGTATFADTAEYNDRASSILGSVLSGRMPSTPDSERAKLCEYLLRHLYNDTNEMCAAVQQTLDKANGIQIAPQKAPFPAERVQAISGSLEDKTVPMETIQRRAGSAATVGRAFHDAYMRENAKFRTKAGIKCYIVRDGGAKCCPWCAEMVGRYAYGDEPHDVYRRHDNCSCTVTFENGRQRQDVWSKQTWEVPGKDAGADPPTVFTDETRPQGFVPTVLTPSAKSGTIRLTDMFHKDGDDPMFEVTGRAIDSNPREVSEMISRLQEWGVSIHRGQSTLGYGCIRNGEPGAMSITDDASFSAWRHEFDHAEQDRAAGWNGVQVLWFDPAERERRERSAYAIEIQLARDAGREDIVERLEANRDAEIEKIWHDYYERFGYPD